VLRVSGEVAWVGLNDSVEGKVPLKEVGGRFLKTRGEKVKLLCTGSSSFLLLKGGRVDGVSGMKFWIAARRASVVGDLSLPSEIRDLMRSNKDWNLSVTEVVLEVRATSCVKCSGEREHDPGGDGV